MKESLLYMKKFVSQWNGYEKIDFDVNGRESFVVLPKERKSNSPWVWRTEFFYAFNFADMALLEKGYCLAYHCVSDMYGCPKSVEMLKEFYDAAVSEFGLNAKPAIFGFSRGGLYAVNFALKYPSCCAVLYLDAPVLDIRSWPGGLGEGCGEKVCWEECLSVYGLSEEEAASFKENPLDRVDDLARTGIPVILVCGAKDKTVPYSENGKPFFEKMKGLGANIECIVKPDCDHHPHSLENPAEIVEFIENIYADTFKP